MKLIKGIALLSSAAVLSGCFLDDSDDGEQAPVVNAPANYEFTSKIDSNSSVSHSGQASRHLLINELKALIGSDELQNSASAADALAKLNKVYSLGTKDSDTENNLAEVNVYTDAAEATPISITPTKAGDGEVLNKVDFSAISGDKNLEGKIAGQDNDLTNEFIGWDVTISGDQTDNDRPNLLVKEWFAIIAELAADGDANTKYLGTDSIGIEGVDYQQLVQKFLLGAVTYSQAAEDYLKASKGLMKQNSESDNLAEFESGEDQSLKSYTSLEHQWDEGFGYFGAAHDFNSRTDAEVKAAYDFDTNEDGKIDLYSEYSYGHSINAVKRDLGAEVAVDFSKAAMDAFLNGRQLIQDNFGTDPVQGSGYQKYLAQYAETALDNWENAVAATVVHYINDTVADLKTLDTAAPASAADIAKHWSEMKGFALGLQFSPVAQISHADLEIVLNKMAEAPVTSLAGVDAYIADLESARATMQSAYGFDATNVANW